MLHERVSMAVSCVVSWCHRPTHPPAWVVEREAEIINDAVIVGVEVGCGVASTASHFDAHAEAIDAQVKVGADGAADADLARDILLAVVAVILRPVGCSE